MNPAIRKTNNADKSLSIIIENDYYKISVVYTGNYDDDLKNNMINQDNIGVYIIPFDKNYPKIRCVYTNVDKPIDKIITEGCVGPDTVNAIHAAQEMLTCTKTIMKQYFPDIWTN